MTAEMPGRRKMTAREAAERLGCAPRTIRKIMAEPRSQYLARAAERRAKAVQLRSTGLKYTEIAAEMDITVSTVKTLMRQARLKGEVSQ